MAGLTERLQRAIQRLDELSPRQQDVVAGLIEGQLAPAKTMPSYAGSMPDLPDDFEEDMMRRRHSMPPTPPMDEELHEVLEDDQA